MVERERAVVQGGEGRRFREGSSKGKDLEEEEEEEMGG